MKRQGNLFETAFSRDGLYTAWLAASRHKRGKRACFNFERRLGANLEDLPRELHEGSYRPKPYYTFTVFEPKARVIYAPAFRDLVVQHAIYRVVGPVFERGFIAQSFACRVGYGTHRAADYAQEALRSCPAERYTLKLDVRKFFYRIDRAILRGLIERKIKDAKLVDLMMGFADYGEPLGIPIGNLLSQLYALIYLNPVDHFVKRELGVRRYARYVDDLVLFGLTREEAVRSKTRIEAFLRDRLRLELSKSTIAPVQRGVNFVGYRTWRSRRFIRRRAVFNFRRAARAGNSQAAVSLIGHARRTHSLQHLLRFAKEHAHEDLRLPETDRRTHHSRARAA